MDYLLNSTSATFTYLIALSVLNLIINGLPSKRNIKYEKRKKFCRVLNLIINGLPSKLTEIQEFI